MLNSSIALKKYLLFILVLLWQLNIALGLELTVDHLKIEEGWRLEFKDGAILTFRENGNEIKMGWKDLKNDHPWLSSVQVQKKDLTDTDTAAYDRFSKNQNRIAVEKWETWEKEHNLREKIRFEKDSESYRLKKIEAEDKYNKELKNWEAKKKQHEDREKKKWAQKKKGIDQQAEAEFKVANEEYKLLEDKYKQAEEEKCDPEAVFFNKCPERPTKPVLAVFNEAEPKFKEPKPELKLPQLPQKPSPFKIPKPVANKDPAYQVMPLILHLAAEGCPQESFRLQTEQRKFQLVKSQAKMEQGKSPWSKSTNLINCSVNTSRKTLFNLRIDRKRLVGFTLSNTKKPMRVARISSPALREYEEEFVNRDMYLKQLDFKKERIEARYWSDAQRSAIDIVFETSGKKKNIQKISSTLPVHFYDPKEKKKDVLLSRIHLFQERKLGNIKQLTLRRFYSHKPRDNPKNWLIYVDILHALHKNNIANVIKVKRSKSEPPQEIGSIGLVHDFSSLFYFVTWATNKKQKSYKLSAFFDDKTVKQGYTLNKGILEEYFFQGRKVKVQEWETRDKQKTILVRYKVGVEDKILYRIEIVSSKIVLELKTIGTERIRKNQIWSEEFLLKNRIVHISNH